jgi:hypothetical protein
MNSPILKEFVRHCAETHKRPSSARSSSRLPSEDQKAPAAASVADACGG